MALRNIVERGDPCLNKVCRPVTSFNSRLHTLLDDMRETLEAAEGAGCDCYHLRCVRARSAV